MTSNNETIVNNVCNLSQDDLVDEYEKLATSYRQLKEENERRKQELHQERIQKKTLISTQNDLQHELESINTIHQEELRVFHEKTRSTVEFLKQRNHELQNEKIQFESETEELKKELQDSQADYDELRTKLQNFKPPTRLSDSFNRHLESENESLQNELREMKAKLTKTETESRQKHSQITELNEKILCLEDNLESRKSEIGEKNDAIEVLQETLQDLTVELAMLKSAPEDANRKGNSLFAEVDDQRQKMKIMLQGERAHYLEMKKSFNAKEMEIRRLKRENMNIKMEIQACSDLLLRGEQIEIQTLSTQVAQLMNDNKRLENLVASTELKLFDLAKKTPSLGWLESVLSTANNETRRLKDELFQLMVEKSSLADNVKKNQRELAKTRLDIVKFKILLGRIVVKNNLQLSEHEFIDIGLDLEVFEALKIEQFEALQEQDQATGDYSSYQLSESTIELLGGRERLGNVIPPPLPVPVAVNHLIDDQKVEQDNKENLRNLIKEVEAAPRSPVRVINSSLPVKLSPKIVREEKTEEKPLKTRAIDMNQEQVPRKRQGLVVKRVVIPSKTAPKTDVSPHRRLS